MKGFILFLTSILLQIILKVVMYSYGVIRCLQIDIFNTIKNPKNWFKNIFQGEFNRYHTDLAISNDQHGNVLGQHIMNDLFISRESKHKFGNPDETISSVEGKNKRDETLTGFGIAVDSILDAFQRNHSLKSIDLSEN